MSRGPHSLVAAVFLTVGCGARTDLLVDHRVAPPALDGGDAATGDEEPLSDATTAPDRDGGSDASFDGTTSAMGDAGPDAAPDAPPDAGCGPSSCSGCCRPNGSCVAPDMETPAFCGSGGDPCIACPAGIACGLDTTDGTKVCGHFL